MQHERTRELMTQRLSRGGISGPEAAELREHLAECEQCRLAYDRRVEMLRAMTGAAPGEPAGFESRTLMDETFARLDATEPATAVSRGWLPSLRLAGAAALVAVVVVAGWLNRERLFPPEDLRSSQVLLSRGGEAALPDVGLGVSGVDDEGQEYEVVESQGVCFQDALRFYITSRTDQYRYYFLFGLRPDGQLQWYFPSRREQVSFPFPETQAVAHKVPYEIELWKKHRRGGHVGVGLFSKDPLELVRVERAVETALGKGDLDPRDDRGIKSVSSVLGDGVATAAVALDIIDCGGVQ